MIGVIVASVILIFSTAGFLYFAIKKIPMMLTYPATEEGNSPKDYLKKFISRIKDSKIARQIVSPDIIAQSVLSKTRIVALKTESKTGQILESLRQKSQKKNGNSKFSDGYWKKLRKKKV